jgi:DNA-binding PadR family transcriptional regulator
MKEAGWIEERKEKEGNTITYALTEEGKHALKVAKQRFCQIFIDVMG